MPLRLLASGGAGAIRVQFAPRTSLLLQRGIGVSNNTSGSLIQRESISSARRYVRVTRPSADTSAGFRKLRVLGRPSRVLPSATPLPVLPTVPTLDRIPNPSAPITTSAWGTPDVCPRLDGISAAQAPAREPQPPPPKPV